MTQKICFPMLYHFLARIPLLILSHVQIIGLMIGVIPLLKSGLVGDNAPLRVIEDSVSMLGYVGFSVILPIHKKT